MKSIYSICPLHSSALVLFATIISQANSVLAQVSNIVPDNTLGAESSVVNPRDKNSDSIDGGALRGSNLFHSFQEFNVGEGRGVYFANPDAVSNIFSRVTGGNVSNILGTLGVDGAAELYLINPNGIVFGENAALDIQGSFTATTADAIKFGEGSLFSAVEPGESLLTISVPLGLQFGSSPGSIVNRSYVQDETGEFVGLQVPSGESLTLVGGDINFEAGEATARGGNINIGGLGAIGTVGLNNDGSFSFSDDVAKADIIFSNAADVDVGGTGQGSININARNLRMEAGEFGSSRLRAGVIANSNSIDAPAGNVSITATGAVELIEESGIENRVEAGATGNSGNINITAESLALTSGSYISASTDGRGNAGTIGINTSNDISVDGESFNGFSSGIFSTVGTEGEGNAGRDSSLDREGISSGDAGAIFITTDNLNITNGGLVSTNTNGRGNAGSVEIYAMGTIIVDGERSDGFSTGVFSSVDAESLGNAGVIFLRANNLNIINGGLINTSVDGIGNSGSITVEVSDAILISGTNADGFSSGIFSTVGYQGYGNGGNVSIATVTLEVIDGAAISTRTFGAGNAGNITINASELVVLEGENSSSFASIDSSVLEGAIGDGGNVSITTGSLEMINDAFINTGTLGDGNAGKIILETNRISLENSLISTTSDTIARSGDMLFNAKNTFEAQDSLINASSIESSGGEIDITAKSIRLRGNSDIITSIGDLGGSITLSGETIVAFDDSDVIASARDGQGGNIILNTPAFFAENFTLNSLTANSNSLENNSRADINATGNVAITDVSFIQNSLTELPDNSINTDELVANSCVVPAGDRSQGKFIITGGESLPVRPGDNLPSKYPTGEVRGVIQNNTSSWQPGDPIVEPQGAYRLANGKMVLSRECPQ